MTPDQFKSHRQSLGSQRVAARELGIGFRTIQRIEKGKLGDPVPVKYQRIIAQPMKGSACD